ncbi:MAG: UDP-N-acetylglucosamine 2-epimerase (non-hydrolyzing) [Methanomassiliicoccales archaeon]|nr:UDP-N-acetylglucosamine 2-epimerase (non-hydrolyzing) [Methanomassiliicoccales archaeon]
MKIMTVLGTRPEIIRLSRIIPLLDENCDHILLHTCQNFDRHLSDIFFEELGVRAPDIKLDIQETRAMDQIGRIISGVDRAMEEHEPDRLLILGDTNSGLSAICAKRRGISVYHMEAGNRCFDDRVPEEVNRRVIDHSSDVLMPYTERSRFNLINEGIPSNRIFTIGNPIKEVLDYYSDEVESSNSLDSYSVARGEYFLVTLHRAENVDVEKRLLNMVKSLKRIHQEYQMPVIWSVHPRTRDKLGKLPVEIGEGVILTEPLGLFDFVNLEKNARCVLSDSGTVQEECCIFGIPNVTLRDVTERPETMDVGSNILAGDDEISILRSVRIAIEQGTDWIIPNEYEYQNVSRTVLKIIMSCFRH